MLTRRAWIQGLGASLGWIINPSLTSLTPLVNKSWAFGDRERVGVQYLDYGRGAHERPRAAEQLMWEVSKRSSIDVREEPTWVKATPVELYASPLTVLLGHGPCPTFTEKERASLNQYLRAGGLLFVDDISPLGDDRFDRSFRAELQKIWPETSLARVDKEHTIYRSFFLLDQPHGRVQRQLYLEHISFDDLSPILYTRNDVFGAYGRSPSGQWLLPVAPGGVTQREGAFRFGINLVMYATCLNYKRDQVHTLTILRRRKWQAQ